MAPQAVTLVGSTGLTGSAALASLLSSKVPFAVTTFTRRAAPAPATSGTSTYTNNVIANLADAATPDAKEQLATPGSVYVSCLGTTRAAVGGIEAQRAIDLDLNRDLAKKAKEQGAETIILVSSSGANANAWVPYSQMKGQLEDDVKGMQFKNTVILRPGALLYEGNRAEKRSAEGWAVCAIRGLRSIGVPTTALGVDGDDVGAAIAQLAAHPPAGEHTLYNADIIKLAAEFRAAQ